jgi:hypothetical protein
MPFVGPVSVAPPGRVWLMSFVGPVSAAPPGRVWLMPFVGPVSAAPPGRMWVDAVCRPGKRSATGQGVDSVLEEPVSAVDQRRQHGEERWVFQRIAEMFGA